MLKAITGTRPSLPAPRCDVLGGLHRHYICVATASDYLQSYNQDDCGVCENQQRETPRCQLFAVRPHLMARVTCLGAVKQG